MSEKTNINGWTIRQGDYYRDGGFDHDYMKAKTERSIRQVVMVTITGFCLVASFVVAAFLR